MHYNEHFKKVAYSLPAIFLIAIVTGVAVQRARQATPPPQFVTQFTHVAETKLLHTPNPCDRCRLGIRGNVYEGNEILKTKVDIGNINQLRAYLEALNEKYGCTHGIPAAEDANGGNGAEMLWSSAEYFFGAGDRYHGLSLYNREIFAKCITFMSTHNSDDFESIVLPLSTHGGHCIWRAEALVNTMYTNLRRILSDTSAGRQKAVDLQNLLELTYSIVKENILLDVMQTVQSDFSATFEPLYMMNGIMAWVRHWLGMANEGGRNEHHNEAQRYWEMVMSKKYLIGRLNEAAKNTVVNEVEENMVNDAVNDAEIDFDEYCKLTGRTPVEKDQLKEQLVAYSAEADQRRKQLAIYGINGDDDDSLIKWVNQQETSIRFHDIIIAVSEAQGYDSGSTIDSNIMGIKLFYLLIQDSYLVLI
ncbi:MAG: hypothetical protein LBR79_04815 [Oscillospiraceae bacterium]|jgi:hypothetical protein|nr:hypothetical protein [Oscillospiraceae bacterium]